MQKSNDLLHKPAQVIYAFIRMQKEYSVAKWAKFFQVSRSEYYEYIRLFSIREEEKRSYTLEIRRAFDESGSTYGHGRICGVLRNKGFSASCKRVNAYMSEMGLLLYTTGTRGGA